MEQIAYLQRLNDGRSVWLNGEHVPQLAEHPAFKGTVETIQTLLHLQRDKELKQQLTYQTEDDTEAHLSFLVPRTAEDLKKKRDSYKLWADETFGVMSRLSEYTRSLFTGWYANKAQYEANSPGFSEKITRYYQRSRDQDLISTAAGHDPQKHRFAPDIQSDTGPVRVTRKTEDGIFVSGGKMIATAAPYADELLIYNYQKRGENERELANVFFAPVNANGLHIICRESFSAENPEDHPLSARYDEMDAVLVFDDVFIPWERVLACEDPEFAWKLRTDTASSLLSQHQTVVRLVSKLESIVAIGNKIAETAGASHFQHVKEKLAELIIQLETIKALLISAEYKATFKNGVLLPDTDFLATARNLGTRFYPRALEILQQVGAGGLLQVPSSIQDLQSPIGELISPYFKGTHSSAHKRTKLMKLAWDLIGSPLGARHELYERFYSGDPVRTFAAQYHARDKKTLTDFAMTAIK